MFSLEKFFINHDLFIAIALNFGLLIFASVLIFVWNKFKPGEDLKELRDRTTSWWVMAVFFIAATILNPVISYVAIALLSFAALRDLTSVSKNVRTSDRIGLLGCFLAVPIQFYLAYIHWYEAFIVFIPVVMFLLVPFLLVLQGDLKDISRSMAVLPTQLMFCVFGLSHLAYLLSLPEIPGFRTGGQALLLFLVLIVEINDVFQFTIGKLIGKRKIIPKVNPNKTWEGVMGGIIAATCVGYLLRFLTPFTQTQALFISFIIAVTGFAGDVVVAAIKQDAGVKDAMDSIPAKAGILDRIDSLAPAAPVFFHLVYFIAYTTK